MLNFFIILYSLIFSLVISCFAFVYPNIPYIICAAAVFALLNFTCGYTIARSRSIRLKALCHGYTLLISFCGSVVIAPTVHILLLFNIIPCDRKVLLYSAIYCVVCLFLLFWNGIICVYVTSIQLGIKKRVIGAICGLIPIANLIALSMILKTVYREYIYEREKEKLNKERKAEKICKTKYPILLVHGVFFRDHKYLNYWGRIPKELEINGAEIYYGNQHSAATVKECGMEVAEKIKEIVEKTGCGKVNIIGHSKGGLDSRYAIENCGIKDKVASLTTINTPHRGCIFAEWLLNVAPEGLKNKVATTYNSAASLLGDENPDFLLAVNDLRADVCKKFDEATPLPENVYCQSVGSVMRKAGKGRFPMNLFNSFVSLFDGRNDGLVGEDSFKWGENYTLLDLPVKHGISHCDMIDLNRENIEGFDVREFYVKLVSDLKIRGL